MKVFIPAVKDINPFFDEIMVHSEHTFIFDEFKKYNASYSTVLIHWPEQLFKWKEPTEKDLLELKEAMNLWKKHAKIVYVVHNLKKHSGMTQLFKVLYDLVESNCDKMIHFGEFSKLLMREKYPLKEHSVICHPLYKNSYKLHEKEHARSVLNINEKGLVVLVPGKVRNLEERNMILKAFKALQNKKKVLLVSSMFTRDFRGRFFLKKYLKIDVMSWYLKFANILYRKPTYHFEHRFLNAEQFSLMLSAADIVFIPRKSILNSGNLFLGMTYKKIIIGPDRGNVSEVLKKLKMPVFDPSNSDSVAAALQKAVDLYIYKRYKYDDKILAEYAPIIVAKQWDSFLI